MPFNRNKWPEKGRLRTPLSGMLKLLRELQLLCSLHCYQHSEQKWVQLCLKVVESSTHAPAFSCFVPKWTQWTQIFWCFYLSLSSETPCVLCGVTIHRGENAFPSLWFLMAVSLHLLQDCWFHYEEELKQTPHLLSSGFNFGFLTFRPSHWVSTLSW